MVKTVLKKPYVRYFRLNQIDIAIITPTRWTFSSLLRIVRIRYFTLTFCFLRPGGQSLVTTAHIQRFPNATTGKIRALPRKNSEYLKNVVTIHLWHSPLTALTQPENVYISSSTLLRVPLEFYVQLHQPYLRTSSAPS